MIAYRAHETLAQASGTSAALPLPAGAAPGDWLLAALHVAGGSGTTITAPSGWELVHREDDGTTASLAVYRTRVTDAITDGDTATFTLSASVECVAACLAYGGAHQERPVDQSDGQANTASTSATAPSVTTTATNAQLVCFWAAETDAPSGTAPSGFTERVDTGQTALSLLVGDARQGAAGASGTKVATLASAEASLGVTVALAPEQLNPADEIRAEGNWSLGGWESQVSDEDGLDALVDRLAQRANAQLRTDVTRAFYVANVLQEPWNARLADAEMQLVQARLLAAAAGIAETGDDNNPAPFLGTATQMRVAQKQREDAYAAIVAAARAAAGTVPRGPVFLSRATTGSVLERFDPWDGTDSDPFDDTEDS